MHCLDSSAWLLVACAKYRLIGRTLWLLICRCWTGKSASKCPGRTAPKVNLSCQRFRNVIFHHEDTYSIQYISIMPSLRHCSGPSLRKFSSIRLHPSMSSPFRAHSLAERTFYTLTFFLLSYLIYHKRPVRASCTSEMWCRCERRKQ